MSTLILCTEQQKIRDEIILSVHILFIKNWCSRLFHVPSMWGQVTMVTMSPSSTARGWSPIQTTNRMGGLCGCVQWGTSRSLRRSPWVAQIVNPTPQTSSFQCYSCHQIVQHNVVGFPYTMDHPKALSDPHNLYCNVVHVHIEGLECLMSKPGDWGCKECYLLHCVDWLC